MLMVVWHLLDWIFYRFYSHFSNSSLSVLLTVECSLSATVCFLLKQCNRQKVTKKGQIIGFFYANFAQHINNLTIQLLTYQRGNADSMVNTVTRQLAGQCVVQILTWARDLPLLQNIQLALRTNHPPIQWPLEPLLPWQEAHHSPPFSIKVKNVWSYTSNRPIWLNSVYRDFTF